MDQSRVSPQNCPKVDRMWNDFATGGDCGALSNSVVRWCHQEKHLTAGDVGLIYLYRVDVRGVCLDFY